MVILSNRWVGHLWHLLKITTLLVIWPYSSIWHLRALYISTWSRAHFFFVFLTIQLQVSLFESQWRCCQNFLLSLNQTMYRTSAISFHPWIFFVAKIQFIRQNTEICVMYLNFQLFPNSKKQQFLRKLFAQVRFSKYMKGFLASLLGNYFTFLFDHGYVEGLTMT